MAINSVGELATKDLMGRFDTDGSPIQVASQRLTSKGKTGDVCQENSCKAWPLRRWQFLRCHRQKQVSFSMQIIEMIHSTLPLMQDIEQ